MARVKRASVIIVLVVAAAVIVMIIAAASARVPWLPPSMRSEMLQRTFGGDPAAQNLPYVLATFEAVSWYERAVVPGIAGLIIGLLSLFISSFSVRERLYVGLAGFAVLLLVYGVGGAPQWFGGVLFTACLLGTGSLREFWRPSSAAASAT